MKKLKVLVVDDSEMYVKTAVQELADLDDIEVLGMTMLGPRGICDSNGPRRDISFSAAAHDVDVVFLDHNMPTPGPAFLAELRKAGLPETARIISTSTSRDDLSYASERVNNSDLFDPEKLKTILDI